MKRAYVSTVRTIRWILIHIGALGAIDKHQGQGRRRVWLRSLLAIFDVHEMARLDVPWWPFEAADSVEQFLLTRPDASVFEWGSGASTLWLSRRSRAVTSIEHDPDFAADLRDHLPPNVELVVRPPRPGRAPSATSHKAGFDGLDFGPYVEAIEGRGPFDVIVIDGRAREACLSKAISCMTPGGIIIFDNVDRARYREAMDQLLGHDFDVRIVRGLTPALPYPTRAALIHHR